MKGRRRRVGVRLSHVATYVKSMPSKANLSFWVVDADITVCLLWVTLSDGQWSGRGSPVSRVARVLLVAAVTSLMVGGSLGFAGVASAGPPVAGAIVLHCTGVPGELQQAIFDAPSGSTIRVDGTCVGGVFINKDLTLSGPAIIDGGNSTRRWWSLVPQT